MPEGYSFTPLSSSLVTALSSSFGAQIAGGITEAKPMNLSRYSGNTSIVVPSSRMGRLDA